MEISRFKKIISYSVDNRRQAEEQVREFYSQVEMEPGRSILNYMQIGRAFFYRKNFIVVEMPFSDLEVGALNYKGDAQGYVFLNTSLPKVNVNFALCHEIGHILCRKAETGEKAEWYIDEYAYEQDEELAANLFAGVLMMPELPFSAMFRRFEKERRNGDRVLSVLVKLMSYFQAPYMAVLIRCYELKLLEAGEVLRGLITADSAEIHSEFCELWLDESILRATRKDDFSRLWAYAKRLGDLYKKEDYLSERSVDIALKNIQTLYDKIRGDR